MLNFIPKDLVLALAFVFFGASIGYIVKERFFTNACPACICPECPPQNVTNLVINNEKIKAKNGGAIDLTNLLKDNNIIQKSDSTGKKDTLKPKKKGFFKRIFR
ncbi:MAG: hypothetical protein SFU27_06885 [Thermonemataceae bacterium]|nr:hypothetical protein [Thermonemataceae bacterium]